MFFHLQQNFPALLQGRSVAETITCVCARTKCATKWTTVVTTQMKTSVVSTDCTKTNLMFKCTKHNFMWKYSYSCGHFNETECRSLLFFDNRAPLMHLSSAHKSCQYCFILIDKLKTVITAGTELGNPLLVVDFLVETGNDITELTSALQLSSSPTF